MKKYLVAAALLVLAACGKKSEASPAADSTAATDSMARDTTHKM